SAMGRLPTCEAASRAVSSNSTYFSLSRLGSSASSCCTTAKLPCAGSTKLRICSWVKGSWVIIFSSGLWLVAGSAYEPPATSHDAKLTRDDYQSGQRYHQK